MGDKSSNILKLRPVTFNYIRNPMAPAVGLIAEEVYEIMPELVAHNTRDEIETIKYQDLIPLMLNEIQKLNKRISELEGKI